MFKIQEARYGTGWRDVVDEDLLEEVLGKDKPSENLADWIAVARDFETYERYNYRIVDETGEVYWWQCMPFDPRHVNIIGDHDWLEEIRQGYGIDPAIWAKACRVYLDNYYQEQNETAQNA